VKALEAAEASSKLALESNKLGYQVGVRINIDVLNAQQQVYATQQNLAKARYDTIMNGLRLKSAAGTLKEEDVAQVNELLAQGLPATTTPMAPTGKVDDPYPAVQAASATPQSSTDTPNAAAERDAVLDVVNGWAHAWSSLDVQKYLDFYAPDFKTSDGSSREEWSSQRRSRIANKGRINIKVESPQIAIDGNTATVKFRQRYQSDRLKSQDNKTLVLTKLDGTWKIQQERSGE
jgi:outer membrane protein, protease secretion system